ncbi:flagellar basal-body rod modification protein FlgD [Salinibacillus kushneri]|uniref:Flagellar basal-body rod modification protein FlgD n=1 Tax=Salinibacillus kushneri TaxID=237682 RepID=A0A1I0E9D6_9BACI|nr:flagellar hook assembly protein FlgD [Salinibacillus kushneri]SET41705.1 flagellar basal-body rod modification protein FlgD [Salinibacillus kushneri]
MTQIDSSLYLSNQKSQTSGSNTLGKDDFLKILMTQLQNQSPANPMEDKEFISQMATFSSLEQMMSISSSVDQLVQHQSFTPVIEYSHLIGKEVQYQTLNEDGEVGSEKNGIVEGVAMGEEGAEFILQNDERISVNSVTEIMKAEKQAD